MMIPSTTYSTPSLPTHDFPKRPLSANLSSPPPTSLAQRRRNNKNLSLCLLPSDKSAPPSTPFLTESQQRRFYYQQGPTAVLPGLYLGDEQNANNVQQLRQLNIHFMINVAAEVNHPHHDQFQPWDQVLNNNVPCPTLSNSSSSSSSCSIQSSPMTTPTSIQHDDDFSHMGYKKRSWHHHILDDDTMIQQELHAAVLDIMRVRQTGRNVLVHCQCGLARSATVVIAYVMYMLHYSMSDAIRHVKACAPHINPNLSLMYQLREYETWLLNDVNSKQSSSLALKWKSFKIKSSSLRQTSWWRSSSTVPSKRQK
ncbi:protein-tyrosine phosphatase-like protein [Halteromyces radiatus]|uniref:protein-tyrosine phosphatase-like protein n=1 Tax=Halteromyces radiatus TaxID=101107 RepID=UPI00221E7F5B|nr:protein-tyrosine phosphatase-like protein [Halteromyces radiatus]KAI8099437.1 protein-tyrosine phosphatase-like protein [Halteromyces radiatus]